MKIESIKPTSGRDLYGKLTCEHCGSLAELRGGYDDGHWHSDVLPAFHCAQCGLNRAGQLRSLETYNANQARGVNGMGMPLDLTLAEGTPVAQLISQPGEVPHLHLLTDLPIPFGVYSLYPDQEIDRLKREIRDLKYDLEQAQRKE